MLPLILLSLLPGSVVYAQTFNTSGVSITSATYSGSGCPAGSVSASLSFDKTTITLGFDSVNVYLGPGTTPSEKSKNCALHLQLSYPAGWRFVIEKTRWHGIFALDEGVSALLNTMYEVVSADIRVINVPQTNINGTRFQHVDGDTFDVEYSVKPEDEIPSTCGHGDQGSSDGVVVHDRFGLVAKRTDSDQAGLTLEGTALVQQIGLRWVVC